MPTTTGIATEFIQFSRTSNATVTDSNGFIKWAPANLLLNSESFDTASWAKTTTTVAANSIAAPNGTTTADTLTAAGANSTTLQSYTALAVPYTFGVWLKRKTGTGNIQIAADSGTYTTVTITSDWALYTVSQTPAAGTISAGIRIVTSADEVYVWGASIYRSDLGGMQPNTSAYPLYNPTTPKNLAGFTEDFSGTGWTRVGLLANGSGSVANAIANPINGLQTADLTVEDTSTGNHALYRPFTSVANTPYLWSVYVKPAGRTFVQFAAYATALLHIVEFDLTGSGTYITRSGSGTAAITALSGGWYRISTIATATGSGTAYWQLSMCNPANTVSYTGDGTSGIYLWGAQISDTASLDTYSPVYGAAVTSAAYYGPRRDFNGSTLACNGLLVEELRTNSGSLSNAFTTAPWQTAGTVASAQNITGPDGAANSAWTLTDNDAASICSFYRALGVANDSVAYSVSAFIKKTSGATTFPALNINILGGSVGVLAAYALNTNTGVATAASTNETASSAVVQDAGGFWRLCISTANNSTGNTVAYYGINPAVNTNGGSTFVASTTGSAVFYGFQIEAGAFATSYIPTEATSATRTADTASVSAQAFPYSASASSLVVNAVPMANQYANILELSASAAAFGLLVYQNLGSASVYVDATSVSLGAMTAGTVQKIGIAYDGSANGAVKNGGTVSSVGTTVSAPANKLGIGSSFAGGSIFNGYIRQITYLPRRITNTELQTRTA